MPQDFINVAAPETAVEDHAVTSLEQAMLLAVVYSDLFDYPLSIDELFALLPARCRDRAELEQAVAHSTTHPDANRRLVQRDGYLCLAGRDEIIDLRQRRRELAARRWPAARRFGRWLSKIPFVRMVAVCGSHAVENGDANADVDLFLITAEDRLWLVHVMIMALKRFGRFLGVELCPNYLLTATSLEVENRNLYSAREIAQAVPLWGEESYDRFLAANRWIDAFLPQAPLAGRRRLIEEPQRRGVAPILEKLLGGAFGTALDRFVHRLMLRYYRVRLRHYGWTRENVADAYRRDRQMVIHGGFSGAVASRFFDAAADLAPRAELERCFFGNDDAGEDRAADEADPLYSGIMDQRYGQPSA